jgi:hypothetical protein
MTVPPAAPELDQLAAFVADLQPGDLPGEVRDRAALHLACLL